MLKFWKRRRNRQRLSQELLDSPELFNIPEDQADAAIIKLGEEFRHFRQSLAGRYLVNKLRRARENTMQRWYNRDLDGDVARELLRTLDDIVQIPDKCIQEAMQARREQERER